ncbi:MAG: META domain-containing protein [Rhodobiaceae bacterium]|nr:META domain-containing protein [Rhodobiaceae bacterium]MCC0053491.1 META domain-containing protein [Rhodobiaceae bacterium]
MSTRVLGGLFIAGAALGAAMVLAPHSIAGSGIAGADAASGDVFRIHTASLTQYQQGPAVTAISDFEFAGTWKLTHLRGPDGALEDIDPALTARSEIVIGDTGRLSGTVGCNRFGTQISLLDDRVALSGVVSTRKACQGPVWDAERGLYAAFKQTASMALDGDTMVLVDARGKEIARFVRA